jgi:sarcosine oxidase subunit beta
MVKRADVVIIGGGIVGVAIAYHLAQRKLRNAVLIERGFLGEGSTGLCAGGIRTQFSTGINIRFSQESLAFWTHFENQTGVDLEFRQTGYLFLSTGSQSWDLFQRNLRLQRSYGLPVELLHSEEIRHRWPFIRWDDLLGGTFCALDGYAGPHEALTGMIRTARREGIQIYEQTEVVGLHVKAGRVRGAKTTGGDIETGVVVNAAGPWASTVAKMAGVDIPVTPIRRQLFATTPFDLSDEPIPLVIDFDRGWYFRPEGRGFLLAGPTDREPSFRTTVDRHAMVETSESATRRVPALEDASIAKGWAPGYTTCHRTTTPSWGPCRVWMALSWPTDSAATGFNIARQQEGSLLIS